MSTTIIFQRKDDKEIYTVASLSVPSKVAAVRILKSDAETGITPLKRACLRIEGSALATDRKFLLAIRRSSEASRRGLQKKSSVLTDKL